VDCLLYPVDPLGVHDAIFTALPPRYDHLSLNILFCLLTVTF
jgi:hypothetical protein